MTGQPEPAPGNCRQDCQARTALREVLASLYALTRLDRTVIAYQTVNLVPPASYERWQAALNPPTVEPAHDAGPDIADCAAADRAHWNDKYDRP
jgi:hypothetical protein